MRPPEREGEKEMRKIKDVNDAARLMSGDWVTRYCQVLIDLHKLEEEIEDGWRRGRYTIDERNEIAAFVRRDVKKFAEAGTPIASVLFRYDRGTPDGKLMAFSVKDDGTDDVQYADVVIRGPESESPKENEGDAVYMRVDGRTYRKLRDSGERYSSRSVAISTFCERYGATERRTTYDYMPAMFPTEDGEAEYDVGVLVEFRI